MNTISIEQLPQQTKLRIHRHWESIVRADGKKTPGCYLTRRRGRGHQTQWIEDLNTKNRLLQAGWLEVIGFPAPV